MNDNNSHKMVHILTRDKFTRGYIAFMKECFPEYTHTFFTFRDNDEYDIQKDVSIFVFKDRYDFMHNKKLINELQLSDIVIVSGMYGSLSLFGIFYRSYLHKTYFQFWGGDFYCCRNFVRTVNLQTIKLAIHKKSIEYSVLRCAGVINLISSDWDEFYKIFPYNVRHFVAPMPGDPNNKIDYKSYRMKRNDQSQNTYRILLGNSATITNNHISAFKILQKFASEDIEIIVPLSYGDDDYGKFVIEKGHQIFEDKFHPITEFMDKNSYIELLNTCDVGVFNNDRQQAMGNISILFSLGKKVYFRKDTSMWAHYKSFGIIPHDINDISNLSFNEFVEIKESERHSNIKGMDTMSGLERSIDLWRNIFENEYK